MFPLLDDGNKYTKDVVVIKSIRNFITRNKYSVEKDSKVHLYFHIDGSKASHVFKAFSATADEINQMANFLPDDDTQNYHVTFSINRINDIAFADYCLTKGEFCGLAIYNYPLQAYLAAIVPDVYPMPTNRWHYSELQLESFREILSTIFDQLDQLGETQDSNKLPNIFPSMEFTRIGQLQSLKKWLNSIHPAYIESSTQPHKAACTSLSDAGDAYKKDNEKIRALRKALREKYSEIAQQLALAGELKTKWVSELKLFKIVYKEYPDAVYQYRAKWLGQQSLDIFIPSQNIGVEYQGEQHYIPLAFFGGMKGLENRQMLDDKKRVQCEENGDKLIEWHYEVPITYPNLIKKINEIT